MSSLGAYREWRLKILRCSLGTADDLHRQPPTRDDKPVHVQKQAGMEAVWNPLQQDSHRSGLF